jgi:PAS domain S-box-containing protein
MSTKLKPDDDVARALFENAPVAMLMIDKAGTVEHANSAAEQLFGYSRVGLVGKPVELLVPDGLRQRHKQHREAFFKAPAPRPMGKGRRLCARHKDGHEIPVEVGLNPVMVASNRIAVLASFVDNSAQERAENAELLVRELTHRAKNLFAVISAMAHQIGMVNPDVASFQSEFDDRLHSIATSYELLVRERWQGALIADLVRSQLAFVDRRDLSHITTEGPALRLSASPAEHLGLAIHELATKALKYGALSVPGGSVRIRWATDEAAQRFQFKWRELDGPAVARPQRKGFGLVILNTVVPAAFGGTAALCTSLKGVSWDLDAPLAAVISSVEEDAIPGGRSPLRPSKSTYEKA